MPTGLKQADLAEAVLVLVVPLAKVDSATVDSVRADSGPVDLVKAGVARVDLQAVTATDWVRAAWAGNRTARPRVATWTAFWACRLMRDSTTSVELARAGMRPAVSRKVPWGERRLEAVSKDRAAVKPDVAWPSARAVMWSAGATPAGQRVTQSDRESPPDPTGCILSRPPV